MPNIQVEASAASWYKQELGLADGDALRFYVYLGGSGSVVPGFSLGVSKEVPRAAQTRHIAEGVLFYMEDDQLWYLDGKDLHVSYDEPSGEIMMKVF